MIILLVYGSFSLGNMRTAVRRLAFVFDYLNNNIAPFKLKIGF